MSDPADPPLARPVRRRWGFGTFVRICFALLLCAAVGSVFYLRGKPMAAPLWVEDKIRARLAQEMPQLDVSFGELVFVLDEDWVPRVRLRDVNVAGADGRQILHLNEFKAAVAGSPLLQGQVQPREMALTGVVARVRRGRDGRVSIQAGQGEDAPVREGANLPQLVGQLDAVLQSPALAALNDVDLRALTLRYEDLQSGRVWTVDGGRARLIREADNLTLSADLAVLSGGTGVATVSANYTSRIGEAAAAFGVQFDGVSAPDIAAQSPAFAWLEVLQAPISGAVRTGLTETGGFQPLNATLQIGAGALQPTPQTEPIPFDGARSYFRYLPQTQVLQFDELSVASKWITGQATGTAQLGLDPETGQLDDLVAQIQLSDLRANPRDLYAKPVNLSGADADLRLTLNPFKLQLGRAQIKDAGQTLQMNGTLEAAAAGWQLALNGQMDQLSPARLLQLWPKTIKPKTWRWLDENLLAGDVRNVDLALRVDPGAPPLTHVSFDFDNTKVRFMKKMPPVDAGQGHFELSQNRLIVVADQGQVTAPDGGAVDVAGTSFVIPDVRIKDGTPAQVKLKTQGSVPATLSLLNQPPLLVMDKAGLPYDLAQGTADLRATIDFPLKKGTPLEQVRYEAGGALIDVKSDTLVKNRKLRSEFLTVLADNANVSIAGQGTLDGVRFSGNWAQPIGKGSRKSRLKGQIVMDPAALAAFNISLPDGMVKGTTEADITLEFEKGAAPKFALSSDLQGVGLSVPQVSWSKPARRAGKLRISGQLGAVPKIDQLDVSGPGLAAEGSLALRDDGQFGRVRFDRLKVGNWLNVPLDLVGQGKGKPVQVVLRGGTMDLRAAEFGSGGGGEGSALEVGLDRLQITDTIALTDMRGTFGTTGGLEGAFQARLNGQTLVDGVILPQNGRSAIQIRSKDAGGVLRSAGLLKQIVGGDLTLLLIPVGSGGAFDGRLSINGVRVKDAPGIAALLNAVSIVGLVNEMAGDGIYFEDVEGSFRLTPNRLTLIEGSAVGASMGLSMDGVYELDSNRIDMQGVLTPVYLLNGIGSILTRKGEGLIGFSYRLRGLAKEPKVSVNPLSALTPGLFREIFRRPPPERPVVEGISKSVLPTPEPKVQKKVVDPIEWR